MKKLALVLSLVLMLTFVGCSSKTTMKETDAFRFDSKTGYAYSTAPFGIDTDNGQRKPRDSTFRIYELFIGGHRAVRRLLRQI